MPLPTLLSQVLVAATPWSSRTRPPAGSHCWLACICEPVQRTASS